MSAFAFRRGMGAAAGILSGLTTLSGPILGLVSYIFSALALYTLAERRGIRNSWLAWIPIANVWVLGSLSDQYRYVVRGEIRSKRKVLLILRIISSVLGMVLMGIVAMLTVGVMGMVFGGMTDEQFLRELMGPAMGLMGMGLPLAGIGIAYTIIRFIALYDVYLSCDPQNGVLFLVLSIFIGVTRPFFLFACRNKDYGMPPRRMDSQPDEL